MGLPSFIREVALDQIIDDVVVDVLAFGLKDELGVVPLEAEPAEVVKKLLRGGFGGAGEVGVFDAQEELAAGVAGEEPVEERGSCAADVEVPGGGGGEAGDDGLGHDRVGLWGGGRGRQGKRVDSLAAE